MIRSPARAAVIFLVALALGAWYDCLTTHRYIPVKHTIRPPVKQSALKPGADFCLKKVPPTKPAAVLEIFHDGEDFDLVVRLDGKDLPLYQVNHYLLIMPPGMPPAGNLCLKNAANSTVNIDYLEIRNFTAFNSGFPRFYILPRQLVPVVIHPLTLLRVALLSLLAMMLWWSLTFKLLKKLEMTDRVTAIFLISLAPLIWAITTSLGAIFLSSDRILFLKYEVSVFTAMLVLGPQAITIAVFWVLRRKRATSKTKAST